MRRAALPWLAGAPLAGVLAAALLFAVFLDWSEGVPPLILAAGGAAFLGAAAWLPVFARAAAAASPGRAALAGLGAVVTAQVLHAGFWASRQALSFGLDWSEAWLWQRKLQLWAGLVTVPLGVGLAVLLARLLRPAAAAGAAGEPDGGRG